MSSPSPTVALADKVKLPIEACDDTSRSPEPQRLSARKLRAFELNRTGEDRPELAWIELAGDLDAILAGQRGLEMLDRELAVTRPRDAAVEIADEIAAKAGLLDS